MGPPSTYQTHSLECPVTGSAPIPPPTPSCPRYHALSASGAFARKKYPPIPTTGITNPLTSGHPLHVGAERDKVVDEVRMRAADRVGVEDRRFAVDRRGDHQQRDRNADDVRTGHGRRGQFVAAERDQTVRIAQQ